MCVLLLSHLNKMLNVCTPLISPQQNVKCVYSSYLTSKECYMCVLLLSPLNRMLNVCTPLISP